MESLSYRQPLISGITFVAKKIFPQDKGAVFHMLRCDSPEFDGAFGEVYFSNVASGAIKGWKCHKEMSQRFAVPRGEVDFVFYDNRDHSASLGLVEKITLNSSDKYGLLLVPPLVWYSFRCTSEDEALIVNCSSIPYTDGECLTRSLDQADFIPYSWS